MKKSFWKDIREMSLIIGIFLLVQTQICAQARIPSNSMVPTLNVNDRLIINKLATKYKEPDRGDIVVFIKEKKLPFNEYWIKRVIALPNEVVDIKNGRVYIDDIPVQEDYAMGITASFINGITFPYTVPEDHYFLLGDNREGSRDCREFGAVKEDDIIAIGGFKIYPFSDLGVLE